MELTAELTPPIEVPEFFPQDALIITAEEGQVVTAGIFFCQAPKKICIQRDWCEEHQKCYFKERSQ
jgi:hypothetical protein